MEFEKLYAPSLKDLFVKNLQGLILSGELPHGSKLPSERELCQQMQVSRAVVNAGISELARQGFLEVRPRQGAFVADYRSCGNMDTLKAIMDYNGGMLGKEEIRSILEVRQGLEYMTVSRVIDFASDDELEALGRHVDALGAFPAPSFAQASEIAFAFQHKMTLIGGNNILPLIYTSFKVPCISLWIRFCRKYGVAALHSNVERLYRFLLNRDKASAFDWIDTYLGEAIYGNQQIYEE
ncbi:MAG: FadR family transcriptional regulator [Oscillospiraceae bacterium]|nr:FadR family transcriptional regulator [Oscillospiraceae bacterium]